MYSIPILDQSNRPVSQLKNARLQEFNNMYKLSLNEGLIKPLMYSNPKGVPIATFTRTGLNNIPMSQARKYLFSNNYEGDEYDQYTDEERLQQLQNAFNKLPPLSELEKQIQPYENTPFSPMLRQQLVQESIKNNTNIYFEESQDFVKEYQTSLNNQNKELNLFSVASNDTQSLQSLLTEQNKLQTLNNMLIQKSLGIENKKKERYINKMNRIR